MLHWLSTAFSTYILHSEHGNGYQFWSSGPGPGIGQLSLLALAYTMLRKHNCYEHRCLRIGTHRSQLDQHVRCRRHHEKHKTDTEYVDAKAA